MAWFLEDSFRLGADQSLRRPAPVNQDVGAGHEASLFGAEIESQLSDLFLLAPAPDRNL